MFKLVGKVRHRKINRHDILEISSGLTRGHVDPAISDLLVIGVRPLDADHAVSQGFDLDAVLHGKISAQRRALAQMGRGGASKAEKTSKLLDAPQTRPPHLLSRSVLFCCLYSGRRRTSRTHPPNADRIRAEGSGMTLMLSKVLVKTKV